MSYGELPHRASSPRSDTKCWRRRLRHSTVIAGDTTGGEEEEHRRFAGARTPPRTYGFLCISPRARTRLPQRLHRGERALYPSARTCPSCSTAHPPPTRHAPHALARARSSRSDAIAAASPRALRGPRPGLSPTNPGTRANTRTHAHLRLGTHPTVPWSESDASSARACAHHTPGSPRVIPNRAY